MNHSPPPPDFFVAGGTLRSDSPSYVARPADAKLHRLALAGRLCYILTTRQMGKSSLMNRVGRQLQDEGTRTALIDLTSIGTATIDEWYLSLLDDLQFQLSLSTDAEAWWSQHAALTPVKRFTKFIHEVVLTEVDGPIVIFIDEIDSALNLDFSDDFFAAVRAIHNQALTTAEANRLAFVLLGVAAPNDLIKDQHRTPFNIGERIDLKELALEDARHVFARGLPQQDAALVERIFYWTGGHPYLTQKIGQTIARSRQRHWCDADVDELVQRLFLTERARSEESNLQFVHGRVTASPRKDQLLRLYRNIHRGKRAVTNDERSQVQTELKLYGLVKVDDAGRLTVRNRIYRRAFNQDWIRQHAADQRRRNLFLILVVALLILAGLTTYIWQQNQRTDALLAQTYRQGFTGTENPTLRLDNLARLLALPGYEEEAVQLFATLPVTAQVALFTSAAPDVQAQTEAVIQATYTTLSAEAVEEPAPSTPVLAAMRSTLRQFDRLQHPTLPAEIDSWLEGRQAALDGDYETAQLAYSVALRLNEDNPAVLYERALASLALQEEEAALADLEALLGYNQPWPDRVRQTVTHNPQLYSLISGNEATLTELAAFIPTATSQPTSAAVSSQAARVATRRQTSTLVPAPSPTPTAAAAVLVEAPLNVPHTALSGTIIYTCFVDGVDQICAIEADGSAQRQLTFNDTTDWYGVLAPEGEEIAFSSARTGVFTLYRADVTGDNPQSMSPPGGEDYAPAYAPDGSQIAFTRSDGENQNIWVMNRDGSGARALTDMTGDALDPVWSPDGARIAFAHRPDGGESFRHIIIDADGTDANEVLVPIKQVGGRSNWSPDGRWLAFYAGPVSDHDIYLASVDGSQVRRLTEGGDNLAPSFSPDGNWIVFTSGRDGDDELYAMRLDGSDLIQLTSNERADWQPSWGP